jgi:hypothetical protein
LRRLVLDCPFRTTILCPQIDSDIHICSLLHDSCVLYTIYSLSLRPLRSSECRHSCFAFLNPAVDPTAVCFCKRLVCFVASAASFCYILGPISHSCSTTSSNSFSNALYQTISLDTAQRSAYSTHQTRLLHSRTLALRETQKEIRRGLIVPHPSGPQGPSTETSKTDANKFRSSGRLQHSLGHKFFESRWFGLDVKTGRSRRDYSKEGL